MCSFEFYGYQYQNIASYLALYIDSYILNLVIGEAVKGLCNAHQPHLAFILLVSKYRFGGLNGTLSDQMSKTYFQSYMDVSKQRVTEITCLIRYILCNFHLGF